MPDLKDLRDNREEILKAELAAWLHDVGKFCNLHVESHTNGPRRWGNGGSYKVVVKGPGSILSPLKNHNWIRNHLSKRLSQILQNKHPTFYSELHNLTSMGYQWEIFLHSKQITIPPLDVFSVAELIMLGLPGASKPTEIQACFSKYGWLPAALGICHGVAHHDKQDGDGSQSWPTVFTSTAFGFESPVRDLDKELQQLYIKRIKQFVIEKFDYGLGDTRRPVNEVTLLDWVWTVAALYKASVSHAVLDHPLLIMDRDKHDLRWRLLSIRTNGLEYLLSAPSIPDLKARQELLQDAWNRVQNLLEEEYPLALEVYRDENGPVFVVPDIDNLLGLTDSDHNAQTLREFILERFRQGTVQNDPCLALEGEIVPAFRLDAKPWKGQPVPRELPPIGDHVRDDATPPLKSDSRWVAAQWCNLPQPQERCTVCGLRPQGPSPKARRRGRCDVCEKRRVGRAKEWAANLGRAMLATIWLDEVADRHGRIALLVGSFDLSRWLDGTLVRSLAVRNPENCGQNNNKCPQKSAEYVAKNPSFARLRRIWETTRKFWEETLEETERSLSKRSRIFLKGTLQRGSLGPYHAYELEIQGRRVAVLWVPEKDDEVDLPEEYRGGFWVIENLDYLDNVYGRSFRDLVHELAGQPLKVYEPTEYGRPGHEQATFTIARDDGVQDAASPYTPFIPILAEPRTFMALVPADKALDVVRTIKTKYEREMGRVRNRLPLHLGIVFSDSHQPLRTILDAGRRMLKQQAPGLLWRVVGEEEQQRVTKVGIVIKHPTKINLSEASLEKERPDLIYRDPEEEEKKERITNQFKTWHRIVLLSEERFRRCVITWYIPAVMGDGQTEDHWYPYVFLTGCGEPSGRSDKRYFLAKNPWNPSHPWLVHAAALNAGDRIYFTPATFDFIFLDHGGRRFAIAYDEHGRRRGTLHRPYLLDEIADLQTCWEILSQGLGTRQLHQVRDLIETKRKEWFDDPQDSFSDKTFKEFCRSVLTNAKWEVGQKPNEWKMERLTQWAVTGLLADTVELFHHIMKQQSEESHRGTGNTKD